MEIAADLYINGTDALTYGAHMGDGFLDAIGTPAALKEYITNDNRLENGVRYSAAIPKLASREVTLQFILMASTPNELIDFKTAFCKILYAGDVTIQVPKNDLYIYKFKYKDSTSYGQNVKRTICKISVKFVEPNPTDRT